MPANPKAWLIGVARHKAVDRVRRERRRAGKETAAMRDLEARGPRPQALADDQLGLIFACCHPALDPAARIGLTLRSVCGLSTADIAAALLVPEPTMAQRLVRAKRKIRQAGISLRMPGPPGLAERLDAVLRVVYLVFTRGHMAAGGPDLVRGELCDQAIGLARTLAALLPGEPEVTGLLALLLLTDARRGARTGADGQLIVLPDQDRTQWDRAQIAEGERLLEAALRARRPGPYQLHAAIAACHSCAATASATDWRQIAALYGQLIRYEPGPVTEANRAVAVAMTEGAPAGLAILDAAGAHPQVDRWPQFHIARAELLRQAGREADAVAAYQAALRLSLPAAERGYLQDRVRELAPGVSFRRLAREQRHSAVAREAGAEAAGAACQGGIACPGCQY